MIPTSVTKVESITAHCREALRDASFYDLIHAKKVSVIHTPTDVVIVEK